MEAHKALARALAAVEQLPPFAGEEYLYLMASAADRVRGHYDEALQDLDKAWQLKPGYARADVGAGNTYYAQGAEARRLEELALAQVNYEQAIAHVDPAAYAYVPEKANIGLGNVALVRAQLLTSPEERTSALVEATSATTRL